MASLQDTTQAIFAPHKGLLAADESSKSAQKRFDALGIPCTDETRRQYRQMLITTPGIADYLSGVIFYDETFRQSTDDGQTFPAYCQANNIVPGIKVDKGLVPLDNYPDETITEGLDGLAERMREYYDLGARFAKWRAAFKITETLPTQGALHANLHAMARYAAICQTAGIIPIVEPEVMYDGDHTIFRAHEVTEAAIKLLISLLQAYRVDLTGVILKTSMVLAGKAAPTQSTPEEVAEHTLAVLNAAAPKELAGIVFLSGGQTPTQARDNLQAIGSAGEQPWPITFSFSRAVQDPAMKAWLGKAENTRAAQDIYLNLSRDVAAARHGEYKTASQGSDDNFVSPTQDS